MFGLYIGGFLLKKGFITQSELDEIFSLPYSEAVRKIMEFKSCDLADIEKLVSELQNEYRLSDKQLESVKSGDLDKIVSTFIYFDSAANKEKYLRAYQEDNNLSDEEAEAIGGEIEHLLPDYINDDPQYYNRFVKIVLSYLFDRVSDKIRLKPMYETGEYEFESLSYQQLKGAYHVFLGFAGKGNSLLAIANPYGKKEFREMNAAAYDIVCELINCINGLYASELSNEGIYQEILVPHFCVNQKLVSNDIIYCIPMLVDNEEIELLISFNADIKLQ